MTWKTLLLLAAAVGLVLGAATLSTRAGPAVRGGGLFAGLRPGQSVRLIDAAGAYEIHTYPGSLSGTRNIAEIGPDYIAIEDTKNNVTRIPVTAIKNVTIRD